ncbi:hypothetical protein HAZT_HAZT009198 [Hyalella azteca]|uniref:Cuticle Protein CPR RR Uncl n=1 Tax=Hyalella azteca TaxID=294128 RepID=A0A6A0GUB7_HYAAZ|nr:hypothetical protein HAZT_HAZT009198 [Hyalella azteca]
MDTHEPRDLPSAHHSQGRTCDGCFSEQGPPKPYKFSYEVDAKDDKNELNYGHEQESDGHTTKGMYKVDLPDGRKQIVTYEVDHDSGFKAEVTFEGEAKFPDKGDDKGGKGGDDGGDKKGGGGDGGKDKGGGKKKGGGGGKKKGKGDDKKGDDDDDDWYGSFKGYDFEF